MPQETVRWMKDVRSAFGERVQEFAPLASYTTARVGGPAAALIIIHSAADLEQAVQRLWQINAPFFVLGSGSNVLVSDEGLAGVVLINRAKGVKIDGKAAQPSVWAESGANLGTVARQAALRGFSGLEWAAAIPGTVGGAVYGNAGAQGSDMASNLIMAEILHRNQAKVNYSAEQMAYTYRSSLLKRSAEQSIILSARLQLDFSTTADVQAKMEEFSQHRHRTQPPGASLGSMFKNPAGDYAGRLIEAAGLKGHRIGGAEISPVHANFFVNDETARAADIWKLVQLAQRTVEEKMGVHLELEVELLGKWDAKHGPKQEQHES